MAGLLQALHAAEPHLGNKAAQGGLAPLADYLTLKQPDLILRVLNQLHYARSRVTLHVENEYGVHRLHTRIAGVLRDTRQIVLQRPEPQDWRQLIAPGTAVEANCFLDSGQLAFVGRLWPFSPDRTAAPAGDYSCLNLPAEIVRFQMRAAYRVNLPAGKSMALLQLMVAEDTTAACKAPVLDLSLAGCGLRLPADLGNSLTAGQLLRAVQFTLQEGDLRFESDLRICRLERSPDGQLLAGLQFLPLLPAVQRRLQSLLAQLQREQLRRQIRIF